MGRIAQFRWPMSGTFYIMESLALLMVELQTAKRKLCGSGMECNGVIQRWGERGISLRAPLRSYQIRTSVVAL